MTETAEGQTELQRVAAILDAWAANIRADASSAASGERADRTTAMADVLATAAAALRAPSSENGLAAAICAANAIRADGVPRGFDLAQVYTDGREVVVCGEPPADDGAHDCAEMGCGPYAHVIYRTAWDGTADGADGAGQADAADGAAQADEADGTGHVAHDRTTSD